MMRRLSIAVLALTCLLTACENTELSGDGNTVDVDGNKLSTSTPTLLRSIPVTGLSLSVTVNGIEETYQGADTSGGNWLIEVEVEPQQNHTIMIRWYSSTHLLLEEYGEFFAPNNVATIKPELNYLSAGFPRFDTDCDGFSNLEEIIKGTNLDEASDTGMSACDNQPAQELTEAQNAFVTRYHLPFLQGSFTSKLTSYEQETQITADSGNGVGMYSTGLIAEIAGAEGEASTFELAWLALRRNDSGGKLAVFFVKPAEDGLAPDVPGAFCGPLVIAGVASPKEDGFFCGIPYEWQENRWYTLRMEEVSENTWKAFIFDQASQSAREIATVEMPATPVWNSAFTEVSELRDITAKDCALGLELSSMKYKQGTLNNFHPIDTDHLVVSPCAKGGGGWSEGFRTVDGSLEYTMTLGRTE